MKTLRKLVLGETWTLPIAVAIAVGGAAAVRAVAGAGGWWRTGGGFILLALIAAGYLAATRTARRRGTPGSGGGELRAAPGRREPPLELGAELGDRDSGLVQ